jgi:hypothetical protein
MKKIFIFFLVFFAISNLIDYFLFGGFGKYAGPIYQGQLIDAHNTFPANLPSPDVARKQLDEAGIDKIVSMGSSDEFNLYQVLPDKIIPFYRYYQESTPGKMSLPTTDFEKALQKGYLGIGEISLRHEPPDETNIPADSNEVKEIIDLAVKYDVPVNIHQNGHFDELERLLSYNPKAKIILAHAGEGISLSTFWRVKTLLDKYPNLSMDLSTLTRSYHHFDAKRLNRTDTSGLPIPVYLTKVNGEINPLWKYLLEKYADRLMIGGDDYIYGVNNLKTEADSFRVILGQINQDAAEKIAYKNILRLLEKSK